MEIWRRNKSLMNVSAAALLFLCAGLLSCTNRQPLPLIVSVPSFSISKLPFLIAMDQDLYRKNGLDVELWLPAQDNKDRVEVHGNLWIEIWRAFGINTPKQPEIFTDGATPRMVEF